MFRSKRQNWWKMTAIIKKCISKRTGPLKKGKSFLGIELIACHSSLVAHMEQHLHTIQILSCHRSINRNRISVFFPLPEPKNKSLVSKKNLRNDIGGLEEIEIKRKSQNKSERKKQTHWDLDEVIVNRRIQFKLIAIKSGTDSNLLCVTSDAAGPLPKRIHVDEQLAHSRSLSHS